MNSSFCLPCYLALILAKAYFLTVAHRCVGVADARLPAHIEEESSANES